MQRHAWGGRYKVGVAVVCGNCKIQTHAPFDLGFRFQTSFSLNKPVSHPCLYKAIRADLSPCFKKHSQVGNAD